MYIRSNRNIIQKTVNQNIEKNQTPYWRAHNTMRGKFLFFDSLIKLGWCKMNYPRVLINPRLMPKPDKIHPDKNYLLS